MRKYRLSKGVKTRINKFLSLGGKVVDYHEGAGHSTIVVELKLPSGTFEQRGHTYFDCTNSRYSGINYKPRFITAEGIVIETPWELVKNSLKENRFAIRTAVEMRDPNIWYNQHPRHDIEKVSIVETIS